MVMLSVSSIHISVYMGVCKYLFVVVVVVMVIVTGFIYHGFVAMCVLVSNIVFFTVKSPFNYERRWFYLTVRTVAKQAVAGA